MKETNSSRWQQKKGRQQAGQRHCNIYAIRISQRTLSGLHHIAQYYKDSNKNLKNRKNGQRKSSE